MVTSHQLHVWTGRRTGARSENEILKFTQPVQEYSTPHVGSRTKSTINARAMRCIEIKRGISTRCTGITEQSANPAFCFSPDPASAQHIKGAKMVFDSFIDAVQPWLIKGVLCPFNGGYFIFFVDESLLAGFPRHFLWQ